MLVWIMHIAPIDKPLYQLAGSTRHIMDYYLPHIEPSRWKSVLTGGQWRAALGIYESMDAQGLRQDAITCSSLISALAKGKQWALALQVRFIQPAHY